MGVIDFERDHTDGFDPDGIRCLSLFASQVAWALYNVKLFEEIKKANEDLNRVSAGINHAPRGEDGLTTRVQSCKIA